MNPIRFSLIFNNDFLRFLREAYPINTRSVFNHYAQRIRQPLEVGIDL